MTKRNGKPKAKPEPEPLDRPKPATTATPGAGLLDAIAAKMVEVGWSQSDLSRATGIPRQNLSPILRGERPVRIQHLLVIDHALGLDLDYGRLRFADADPTPKL